MSVLTDDLLGPGDAVLDSEVEGVFFVPSEGNEETEVELGERDGGGDGENKQ